MLCLSRIDCLHVVLYTPEVVSRCIDRERIHSNPATLTERKGSPSKDRAVDDLSSRQPELQGDLRTVDLKAVNETVLCNLLPSFPATLGNA